MMETALVFDWEGRTIHWHEPPGRSGGALPDSRDLWDVLWEHRSKKTGGTGRLGGVAHTHPWDGPTGASGTDLSTFRAVELGLGQRLWWPIVTFTHSHWFRRRANVSLAEMAAQPDQNFFVDFRRDPKRPNPFYALEDIEELRARSR